MPACASLAAPGFLLQPPLGSKAHLPEGTDPADLAVNGGEDRGARMSPSPVGQVSHSVLCFLAVSCFGVSVSSAFTQSSYSRPTLPRCRAVLGMFNLLQSQASVFILSSFFFIPV